MLSLAIGFRGAFFGAVGSMQPGAAGAFAQAHPRVALSAALAGVVSALLVVTCLGWLPIGYPVAEARLAAHVGIFTALVLWVVPMLDLGLLRTAWTFPGRVAWHDQALGRIAEVPDPDTA